MGFLFGMAVGMIVSPPLIGIALYLLRDYMPPVLFVPSDWD